MDKLNLEVLYQFYLNKVNLSEETMHEVQRVETKRAFYSGCSEMLKLMGTLMGMSESNPIEAYINLDYLEFQIEEFWDNEIERSLKQKPKLN